MLQHAPIGCLFLGGNTSVILGKPELLVLYLQCKYQLGFQRTCLEFIFQKIGGKTVII